jgi:hypothetical protein
MKSVESKTPASQTKPDSPFFQKRSDQRFIRPGRSDSPFFPKFSSQVSPIQTKLTVGQPNDIYEKEADATADKIVQRMSEPTAAPPPSVTPLTNASFVQEKCAHCEQEEQLQMKPIFESEGEIPEGVQRKCAACEQEEKQVQKKPDASPQQSVSPQIESSLNASKGSGSPLPEQTRGKMESSFGADFTAVRIHNDNSAVKMSTNLNAQAFTRGSDIYFNEGKYDTNSKGGQHLLAHELTHVVQQNGAGPMISKASEPAIMKSEFSSTVSICERLLDSRKFHISQRGGVKITIRTDIPDKNIPGCDSHPFYISLEKSNLLLDDEISTCNSITGSTNTFMIGNLAEGDYYLKIWRSFDNPNCCVTGDIDVNEVSSQEITATDNKCVGSDDSIPNLLPAQKLEKAIRYALDSGKLEEKTKERLQELLEPTSLAIMVGFATLFLIMQTNPLGWTTDTLLIIGGLAMIVGLGLTINEVSSIIDHLSSFYNLSVNAKTDVELRAAGDHLADAITKAGIDVVLAILLHKAGKAAKSYVKPSDPALILGGKRVSMPTGTEEPLTPDEILKDKSLGKDPEGKPTTPDVTPEILKQFSDISDYRKAQNLPAYDQGNGATGTVAKIDAGGQTVYGENSSLSNKGFELRKKGFALLKDKYPNAKFWSQINYLTHAEAHALLEGWQKGILGKNITMFVDRPTCNMCLGGLGNLLTVLGVENVSIFSGGSTSPVIITAE